MVHVKPASTGLIVSVRSCPYRHIPASRRNESRAPSPIIMTSGFEVISLVRATVLSGGMEIYAQASACIPLWSCSNCLFRERDGCPSKD